MQFFKLSGTAIVSLVALIALAFSVVAATQNLAYDSFNNATNISYDNLNRIFVKNFSSGQHNYAYDVADQLVQINDTYGNQFRFAYDSLGRRTRLNDPDVGEWNYTYDLAGNLVSQAGGGGNLVAGDGFYREYNSLNQLVRIRNGSSSDSPLLEQYYYDPFGERIKVWRNDTAGTTIYTPFREFMQVRNSSGVYNFTYVYDGSTLVARVEPDNSVHYYHPDHLGSTTLITDGSGSVVENTFYEPFGAVTSGGNADVKLYTGQFSDSLTNQYYYGARYYKPQWGKFVQPDMIIQAYNPQSLNHYSYTQNNPYKYIDPTGKVAKATINSNKKEITIEAKIYIYGKGATKDLAKTIQGDINRAWSGKSYSVGGLAYSVSTDVNVEYVEEKPTELGEFENAIEILGEKEGESFRSYVSNLQTGVWSTNGEVSGQKLYAHEAGHLFGLRDRYADKSILFGLIKYSAPNAGYSGTLMGGGGLFGRNPNEGTQKDINNLLSQSASEHLTELGKSMASKQGDVVVIDVSQDTTITTHVLGRNQNGVNEYED